MVTPRDDRGWLLALAVDCNRPEILNLLLEFGFDPDARVRVSGEEEPAYTWGMPLYRATRYGKYEMPKRSSNSRGITDKYGNTPLSRRRFWERTGRGAIDGGSGTRRRCHDFPHGLQHADIPEADPRWNGLLLAPFRFWNHGTGPWCHPEWDRGGYLESLT